MTACCYCHQDFGARPYARLRDGIPSVTTVLEVSNFGAKSHKFAWAATEIAAVTAVHGGPEWANLGTEGCTHDHAVYPGLCPACRFLRSEFHRRWTAKANLGNHLHHLAESWSKGEDVETDDTTGPFINALESWYGDAEPDFFETEATLLYDEAKINTYRGTCDVIADINCPVCVGERCRWLLDYKSTEGWWDTEWRIQLAAYRCANWVTLWEDKTEIKARRMPTVAHAGILQLRSDGTYRCEELEAGAAEFNIFVSLRHAWRWEHEQEAKAREARKQTKAAAKVAAKQEAAA